MTSKTEPKRKFRVVGTRPIRHDGWDKVLGRAAYGADVKLPGLVHGAVLRSPHAHARIVKIDTAKAEKAPGVLAVMTAADMPVAASQVLDLGEEVTNATYASDRVMARGKAVYNGHPVAAVAAVDLNTALEALTLIDVVYEVLTPVVTIEQAMAPGAPLVHDDLVGDDIGERVEHTNVAEHIRYEVG
ncbi:MAG: xanthine dehydrogenase family protein molybdopterin-binding subunit, partial [Chloroflexi bacterium]|nr:xanthine dehydrogenase family protein molybdopterin-binding subunit [Chloroflexota bacterium]